MNRPQIIPILLALTGAMGIAQPAAAGDYPAAINFSVTTQAPALQSLSSSLALTNGAAELNLKFAYNSNNTGFSCADGSVLNGIPVTCTGTQKLDAYTVTINNRATKEKITLKGTASNPTVKASYSGPKEKGKLISPTVTVNLQSKPAPVTSTITLHPGVSTKGKLTGTGLITSGYGAVHQTMQLTGSRNEKKGTVSWSLKAKNVSDKLSFAGKEVVNNWTGKLTGTLGPVKISSTEPISLLALSRFHGTVTETSSDSFGSQALTDVTVLLRSDLDNNGKIGNGESQTTTTDGYGKFDLHFPTLKDRSVTVDFNLAGYSQTPKLFASVTAGTDVPLSTSLRKLDDLTLNAGNAATTDNKLKLDNLPPDIDKISGKVFNPITEAGQFPGEFADDSGKMLISSVFSNVQAQDAQGNKVTELANDTELRMLVPTDTWNTMRDLTPGNGQIDVPLYYYDEAAGQWKRSTSDGWLENQARSKLAEAFLPDIQDGTYTGSLYAVGAITHLSYWNIDWPVETHQCVCGRIVDADGNPVAGAIVTAKGVTYSGSSAPVTTGSDGRFCIDVMRSEEASEDLDQDGITGEQHKIAVTVSYNDKYYKLPDSTLPTTPATTASGGCLQLEDIKLQAELELTTSLCTIEGLAVYSGVWEENDPGIPAGTPLPNVQIFGFDSSLEDWWLNCFGTAEQCDYKPISDPNGRFSLKIPVLFGIDVIGWQHTNPTPNTVRWYLGQTSTTGCPTAPITLKLDALYYNTQ